MFTTREREREIWDFEMVVCSLGEQNISVAPRFICLNIPSVLTATRVPAA